MGQNGEDAGSGELDDDIHGLQLCRRPVVRTIRDTRGNIVFLTHNTCRARVACAPVSLSLCVGIPDARSLVPVLEAGIPYLACGLCRNRNYIACMICISVINRPYMEGT